MLKRYLILAVSFFGTLACAHTLPELLSRTGLYSDIANKKINPGVMPFTPQFPLYSDSADKQRWIYLPPSTQVDTIDQDHWKFPAGTRLWKEFRFQRGERLPRVETRLMVKETDGTWTYGTYLWNQDGTEATLAPKTGIANYFALEKTDRRHPEAKHDIPSVAQCEKCHKQSDGIDPVLGFSALQLSDARKEFVPPGELTLRAMVERNLVTYPPTETPRLKARSEIEREALGYLHANCGHCHNPHGRAADTGVLLRSEPLTQIKTWKDEPAVKSLVRVSSDYVTPKGRKTWLVSPGDPSESEIWWRMLKETGARRMPPLGVKHVDYKGIGKITSWIYELEERKD